MAFLKRKNISGFLALFLTFSLQSNSKTYLPASPFFQYLGKQAQEQMGIPSNRTVPIVRDTSINGPAVTDGTCIRVNEEWLDGAPTGLINATMLHESYHVLKQDPATRRKILLQTAQLTGYLARLSVVLIAAKITTRLFGAQGRKLTGGIIASLVGTFGSALAHVVYKDNLHKHTAYCEKRADTMAVKNLNCHSCIEEFASTRENDPEEFWSIDGYLTPTEIRQLGAYAKNLQCPHHTLQAHQENT